MAYWDPKGQGLWVRALDQSLQRPGLKRGWQGQQRSQAAVIPEDGALELWDPHGLPLSPSGEIVAIAPELLPGSKASPPGADL